MMNICPYCKFAYEGECGIDGEQIDKIDSIECTEFKIKDLSAAEFLDLAELYAEKDNNQKVIGEIKTARKLMLTPLIGKKIRKIMQKEADKYVAEQREKKGTNANRDDDREKRHTEGR